jgi:DNA replication protein DnaC
MIERNTLIASQELVSKAVISKLHKHYPDLQWAELGTSVHFNLERLPAQEREYFILDMRFFEQNPSLPLENICSRLENYNPKNTSQEELLMYAKQLIALQDESVGAGLYMFGEAGIGKSHVAISISKEFMKRGLHPNFQTAEHYRLKQNTILTPGQVWIIDDMNSGFHLSSRLFKEVVLNAHDRGGRVFVTSNKNYDELMYEMFVGDGKANRMRYEDRTKGMFKILNVSGDSYRQANAWYK